MIVKNISNKEVIIAFNSSDFIVYFDVFKNSYCLYNKEIQIPINKKTATKLKWLWWKSAWDFNQEDVLCQSQDV